MVSIKTLIAASSVFVLIGAATLIDEVEKTLDFSSDNIEYAPPCVQLYSLLEKYSDEYGVPFEIAIGVAREETGYRGPFHWSYDPKQVSYANAYGAMQIQVPTANANWDERVTAKMLMTDLDLNVHISMKLLARLQKKYGNWKVALGVYNSGRPIVNDYAIRIASGKSNPLK
jgi:soluble lytic murein transglycosylase-like protein